MNPTVVNERPQARRQSAGLMGWALLLSAQALFFNLFPRRWADTVSALRWLGRSLVGFLAIFDVRNWSLLGYIIALSVTLSALIFLKIWSDRAASDAELRRWKRDHGSRR
jgi:hypothetical protein